MAAELFLNVKELRAAVERFSIAGVGYLSRHEFDKFQSGEKQTKRTTSAGRQSIGCHAGT